MCECSVYGGVHNMRVRAYGVAADARSDARCFAPRDQPCAPCKAKRRRRARDARRVARQNGRVFARPDAGPFARDIINLNEMKQGMDRR